MIYKIENIIIRLYNGIYNNNFHIFVLLMSTKKCFFYFLRFPNEWIFVLIESSTSSETTNICLTEEKRIRILEQSNLLHYSILFHSNQTDNLEVFFVSLSIFVFFKTSFSFFVIVFVFFQSLSLI